MNICEWLLSYFHYNSHHHHFHYHCKMHLYHLRILLPILLNCSMIPCLFQIILSSFFWHIFCSSVIPSFSLFTLSKRTQNSFTTSRQILDVPFILIFISIVIYTYLRILISTYLFILIFSLYYYVNLIKLLKYGEFRNYDEILQIEEHF